MKKNLLSLLFVLSCAVQASPALLFNTTEGRFAVDVVQKTDGRAPMAPEVRQEPLKVQHTLAMASQASPGLATPQFLISGKDKSAQLGEADAAFGKWLAGGLGCEHLMDVPSRLIRPERFVEAPFSALYVPARPITVLSAKIVNE